MSNLFGSKYQYRYKNPVLDSKHGIIKTLCYLDGDVYSNSDVECGSITNC